MENLKIYNHKMFKLYLCIIPKKITFEKLKTRFVYIYILKLSIV